MYIYYEKLRCLLKKNISKLDCFWKIGNGGNICTNSKISENGGNIFTNVNIYVNSGNIQRNPKIYKNGELIFTSSKIYENGENFFMDLNSLNGLPYLCYS